MSKQIPAAAFAKAAPLRRNRAQRTFDLPPALHLLTLGGYLAFVGILALAFGNPELVIPFAIFTITIVAGFFVPSLWARVAGARVGRFQSFDEFLSEGIDTYGGHLSGKGAIAQVLIMPAMLVTWALIVAVIRASV